jgi:hypothetical protein
VPRARITLEDHYHLQWRLENIGRSIKRIIGSAFLEGNFLILMANECEVSHRSNGTLMDQTVLLSPEDWREFEELLVKKPTKPVMMCQKCGRPRPMVISEEHEPMHPRYCPYCGMKYHNGDVVANGICNDV